MLQAQLRGDVAKCREHVSLFSGAQQVGPQAGFEGFATACAKAHRSIGDLLAGKQFGMDCGEFGRLLPQAQVDAAAAQAFLPAAAEHGDPVVVHVHQPGVVEAREGKEFGQETEAALEMGSGFGEGGFGRPGAPRKKYGKQAGDQGEGEARGYWQRFEHAAQRSARTRFAMVWKPRS